ncbi:MAG TPA: toll/interleukin-1 receptor domain-containing protein [Pyrinomonadaceae bacterium]|nr:toll/interleukin-1 receptor domain-containing protein [Pyrinomonadaceae bacterium]
MGNNNRVFLSYAWGGESERIVNELDADLQARGIQVVRDKRDLGFKGMIRDFMRQLGHGHAVIVVISDKYLKSRNCMFELVEIARNKDLYDRIFPIVLGDADIYDPVNRIKYIKHWEDKIKELDAAMKSVSGANLQGVREELDSYDEIRDNVSNLTFFLNDINALTAEIQENSNFASLISELENRLATAEPATPVSVPLQGPIQSASAKSASTPTARTASFDAYVQAAMDRLASDGYKELRGERAGRVKFKKAMEMIDKGFLSTDSFRCLFVECDLLTVESFESIQNEVNLYGKELSRRLIHSLFIICVVLASEVPESVQQLIYDTKPPKVGFSDVSIVVMVAYSAAENDIVYPRDLPDDYNSKFEEKIKQYLLP